MSYYLRWWIIVHAAWVLVYAGEPKELLSTLVSSETNLSTLVSSETKLSTVSWVLVYAGESKELLSTLSETYCPRCMSYCLRSWTQWIIVHAGQISWITVYMYSIIVYTRLLPTFQVICIALRVFIILFFISVLLVYEPTFCLRYDQPEHPDVWKNIHHQNTTL